VKSDRWCRVRHDRGGGEVALGGRRCGHRGDRADCILRLPEAAGDTGAGDGAGHGPTYHGPMSADPNPAAERGPSRLVVHL
jgi:hypothetical protein